MRRKEYEHTSNGGTDCTRVAASQGQDYRCLMEEAAGIVSGFTDDPPQNLLDVVRVSGRACMATSIECLVKRILSTTTFSSPPLSTRRIFTSELISSQARHHTVG